MARFMQPIVMGRRFKLLLIEDDRILGPITREALEMCGHSVRVAATSDRADHALKEDEFDIILLDLELGNERGDTLILRLTSEGRHIPEIIILSAQPVDVLKRVQKQLGACGVLQKPTTVEEISAELERCLPVN